MFEVGARVRLTIPGFLADRKGTIARLEPDGMHAVRLDDYEGQGHNCAGYVSGESGRWVKEREMEIISSNFMLKDPLFTLEEIHGV